MLSLICIELGQYLDKTCKIFYNNKYVMYKKGKLIILKRTHSKHFGRDSSLNTLESYGFWLSFSKISPIILSSLRYELLRYLRMTGGKCIKKVNHFLTSLPTNLLTSKTAFTLAEVLITLGIIGIVAAITIPGIINHNKANRLKSQYLKAYSTFAQVQRWMIEDDVSSDPLSYSTTEEYRQAFGKYLKAAVYCGSGKYGAYSANPRIVGCYTARTDQRIENGRVPYRNLTGGATEQTIFENGQWLLPDGTLFIFKLPNKQMSTWHPLLTIIDINGYNNKPNRLGYDLFAFEWVKSKQEWLPAGAAGTRYTDKSKYCSNLSTDYVNGIGCNEEAKNNADYFKWIVKTFK